jgi:DNA-directed RNA polymerase specialized sigma24 family protein
MASDWLAGQFETRREHLQVVAYRMLGALSEADDAVQAGATQKVRGAPAVAGAFAGRARLPDQRS